MAPRFSESIYGIFLSEFTLSSYNYQNGLLKAQELGFDPSFRRIVTQPKLLHIIESVRDEKKQIELILLVKSICTHKFLHEELEISTLNKMKGKIKVTQEMIRLELK